MKIAITAPTGNIGSKLVKQLLDQGGHELTLLCRDPAKVKQHTDRGAKAVQGDVLDAEYVRRATEGADAVFFLSPPKNDAENLRAHQNKVGDNFAAAVRANKLKRVVFLSSFGAQVPDGTGPIAGLHDIEEKLNQAAKEVGANVTHLRPAAFYENWFMNLPTVKEQGAVYMPIKPDAKMPRIATQDIAAVAAQTLMDTKWKGVRVRELLGPQDLSEAECCEVVSKATGKPIKFVPVTPEQAVESMTKMGLSRNVAGSYAQMYQAVEKGIVKPEKPRSAESTTPTTWEQFTKTAIAPAIRG
jgi:uncharacterized protein YbjT (DUF2867 family)